MRLVPFSALAVAAALLMGYAACQNADTNNFRSIQGDETGLRDTTRGDSSRGDTSRGDTSRLTNPGTSNTRRSGGISPSTDLGIDSGTSPSTQTPTGGTSGSR